jgi:hypothetical protein
MSRIGTCPRCGLPGEVFDLYAFDDTTPPTLVGMVLECILGHHELVAWDVFIDGLVRERLMAS